MSGNRIEEKDFDVQDCTYLLRDNRQINILSLNNNVVAYPNIYPLHVHSALELSIVREGSGTYIIGNNSYDFHAGDVFLISNSEPHQIRLYPDQRRIVNTVIHFEPFFLHDFIARYSPTPLLDIFFHRVPSISNRLEAGLPVTEKIHESIDCIEKELREKQPHYPLYVKVHLESIFCEFLRTFQSENDSNPAAPFHKDLYNIDKTLHYISANLGEQLTLNGLAGNAHVSPSYFSSMFKRYMGVSLFEYIARKRVESACHLIGTSSMTFTEISSACGFNNYTSFITTFRKYVGCSPTEYRKSPNRSPQLF